MNVVSHIKYWIKKVSVIFKIFVFSLLISEAVNAITPQQYCERLHARRPAGVTTSLEVLNSDVSSASTVTFDNVVYSLYSKQTKYCKNGLFKYRVESIKNPLMNSSGHMCTVNCSSNNFQGVDCNSNCAGATKQNKCIEGTGCTSNQNVVDTDAY